MPSGVAPVAFDALAVNREHSPSIDVTAVSHERPPLDSRLIHKRSVRQIFQHGPYAIECGMQIALGFPAPQTQDHIPRLAEQPVSRDSSSSFPRLAIFQQDHQSQVMLDKIEGEGLEGRSAAEAITLQRPKPRPQTVLQRVADTQGRLALHQAAWRDVASSSTALS